jgi:hypothetical protein
LGEHKVAVSATMGGCVVGVDVDAHVGLGS